MGEPAKLSASDLRHWRLLEEFFEVLERLAPAHPMHPTFSDPKRRLTQAQYLGLFLFGVFNSTVGTMRQLCAATELKKVRNTVGCAEVSLASFSAAQHVIDPDLLKHVFEELASRLPAHVTDEPRLRHLELLAQDGTLWSALPRMAWAEYGVGARGQAKGVRLHLRFNLLKNGPEDAQITEGKGSETRALREMLLPGQTSVGDRFYGHDYRLFAQIEAARAFFVFRLHDRAVVNVQEQFALTQADRLAGVVGHARVRLGATENLLSMPVRLVEIQRDGQRLLLASNLPLEQNPAELVGLIYQRRWSIELYFRWIKCILGTRHFFAETREGVSIQIYLALIASVLLQLFTGTRPNKRVMEFLQMYCLGWASAPELERVIQKYGAKRDLQKSQ